MVSVRAAKSKGSQFEYDCQYSLSKIYPGIFRTAERGFQMQYDLKVEFPLTSVNFECKRLKGISWNQLVKFYEKLKTVSDSQDDCYVLFQSNRQPCLVFHEIDNKVFAIHTFEQAFETPFLKHPSTRVKKGEVK